MSALLIMFVPLVVIAILVNSPSVRTDPEAQYRTEPVASEDNDYLN